MIIKIIIMILIIIMIIIIIDHWWTQEFQHVLWNSEAEYDHMSHDHPHMLEDSCPLTTNNKIFANSWGMYSLLWDSACNHSALQITKTIPFYFSLSNCFKTIVALFLTFFEKIWLLIFQLRTKWDNGPMVLTRSDILGKDKGKHHNFAPQCFAFPPSIPSK